MMESVVDLGGRQSALARARLGLDDVGRRPDDDCLALRAELQPDVEAAYVVRPEDDGRLLKGLEAGELDGEIEGAGEEAREREAAPIGGHRGTDGFRPSVQQRDRGAGGHAAGAVGDVASQRRRCSADLSRRRSAMLTTRSGGDAEKRCDARWFAHGNGGWLLVRVRILQR